jgi:hypothetical protein
MIRPAESVGRMIEVRFEQGAALTPELRAVLEPILGALPEVGPGDAIQCNLGTCQPFNSSPCHNLSSCRIEV